MSNLQALHGFVEYVKRLEGDEKGEAQLFCDRFFRVECVNDFETTRARV